MTTEGPKYTYSTSSVMTTTAGVAGIEPTMAPVQAITQLLQTGENVTFFDVDYALLFLMEEHCTLSRTRNAEAKRSV